MMLPLYFLLISGTRRCGCHDHGRVVQISDHVLNSTLDLIQISSRRIHLTFIQPCNLTSLLVTSYRASQRVSRPKRRAIALDSRYRIGKLSNTLAVRVTST